MTAVTNAHMPLRTREKLARRARIIDTAIRMLGERGFDAPTVEEIAAAAEVGKGTSYNYFAAKEEIAVAFMVEVEKRVQEKARGLVRARGSLESILAGYVRFHLRLKEPYRDFIRVFLAEAVKGRPELLPHLLEMQKVIDPPLYELSRNLQVRGLIGLDINLPTLVEIFKTLHTGVAIVWLLDRRPYRGTCRLLRQEMHLFCRGLAPPRTRPHPTKG